MNDNPLKLNSSWISSCKRFAFYAALAWTFAVGPLGSVAPCEQPSTGSQAGTDEVYRPKVGEFPIFDNAHVYRGELVFVDHANRRGSLRVRGEGTYFRNPPHPFAMLPYGMTRYHGAPADLRDIPLGTVLHVRAFLPPDPTISSVPVLPIDNRNKTAVTAARGLRQPKIMYCCWKMSQATAFAWDWFGSSKRLNSNRWIRSSLRLANQRMLPSRMRLLRSSPSTRPHGFGEVENV